MKNNLFSFLAVLSIMALAAQPLHAQWKSFIPFPVPEGIVIDISSLASNGKYLFVGGNNYSDSIEHILSRSTDNGASWTTADSTLPSATSGKYVNAMTFFDGKIFAGYNYNGVYASTDNGSSWALTSSGIPYSGQDSTGSIGINAFDTINGNLFASCTIFAGSNVTGSIYRSTDTGASWFAADAGLSIKIGVSSFLNAGDTILGGTSSNGIYYTTNNGGIWTFLGLPNNRINTLAMLNGILFAGTNDSGIFRSTDNGATWKPSDNGISDTTPLFVTSMLAADNILFAATDSGVYFSRNNGEYWNCIDSFVGGRFNPYLIYVYNNFLFAGGGGLDIFRRPLSDYMHAGTSILLRPDSLLFTITSGKGAYNDTLHITNTGATPLIIDSATIHDKNINVAFQDSILPGAQGTIVLTLTYTNQNDTIEKLVVASNDSIIPFDTIDVAITYPPAILLNRDSVVFHVASGNGTYTDTLSITNIGKQTLNINSVSDNDNNLVVICPNHLVSGAQSEITLQLTYSGQRDTTEQIVIVTNDPAHPFDTVYVVITATSSVIESALPAGFGLNVYPNPFSTTTNISYMLPDEEPVTLTVYNTLGQAVAVLANAHEGAGAHSAIFNAAALQSGMYFYRLTAGRNVQTGTMAVVK